MQGKTITLDFTDKFQELVLYICSRVEDDPRFGDVHLNKALFFSDAIALQDLGEPITSARYMKQPKGPVAANLLPARRAMEAAGDVEVKMVGKRRVTTRPVTSASCPMPWRRAGTSSTSARTSRSRPR
jgi:hypothetical protein